MTEVGEVSQQLKRITKISSQRLLLLSRLDFAELLIPSRRWAAQICSKGPGACDRAGMHKWTLQPKNAASLP